MDQNAQIPDTRTEYRSFDEQAVGFIFSINELCSADYEQIPEPVMDAAYAVHSRAYDLLDKTIREIPEWVIEDEIDPDIKYSPYELGELCLEHDTSVERVGFEFWLHSHRCLDDKTIAAFRAEVWKRYQQAADELGATCAYLYTKTLIVEKVTTTVVTG